MTSGWYGIFSRGELCGELAPQLLINGPTTTQRVRGRVAQEKGVQSRAMRICPKLRPDLSIFSFPMKCRKQPYRQYLHHQGVVETVRGQVLHHQHRRIVRRVHGPQVEAQLLVDLERFLLFVTLLVEVDLV